MYFHENIYTVCKISTVLLTHQSRHWNSLPKLFFNCAKPLMIYFQSFNGLRLH
jgi:hypothetical protein